MNEKEYNSLYNSELFAPPPSQRCKLNYEAPKVVRLITNEELMLTKIGINTSKTTSVGSALSRPIQIGGAEGTSSHNDNVFSDLEGAWPE